MSCLLRGECGALSVLGKVGFCFVPGEGSLAPHAFVVLNLVRLSLRLGGSMEGHYRALVQLFLAPLKRLESSIPLKAMDVRW